MQTLTYFFETYGCQMNSAESSAIEEALRDVGGSVGPGWTQAPNAETADLVIINTCSVRATAEQRIVGRLGWYAGLKAVRCRAGDAKTTRYQVALAAIGRPLTLVVTGCMAERLRSTLARDYPVIDHVAGTFEKAQIRQIAADIALGGRAFRGNAPRAPDVAGENSGVYAFPPLSHTPGSLSSFVPIMQGCNNFCSYCIVPYVRGREISRDPEAILAEVDMLSERQVREITLLGQNVNSYSYDALDFPGLLQRVTAHLRQSASPIRWVRFLTSHPKDFSPGLLDVMADEPLLCRHIHLPVQSGSTAILAAMNRRYTRDDYLEKARCSREKLPDATLSTDILVGFPGERDCDFEDTLALLHEVRFSEAFMYYYNPREGTPAVTLEGQLPLKIKKERLQRVIDTQLAILREEMGKRVGETCTVLAEGPSRDSNTELKARTAQNHQVVFPGDTDLAGKFQKVRLESLTGNTFRATIFD